MQSRRWDVQCQKYTRRPAAIQQHSKKRPPHTQYEKEKEKKKEKKR
jgi:hypothetical protein